MSIQKESSKNRGNSFIKNSFILTFGTVVAQIIPLVFYPILSRFFSPSDFGVFAAVNSITSIIVVIASGKYESVILITKTKRGASNLIWLILIISFLSLSLFEVLFYFTSVPISHFFEIPSLSSWIYICPPTAFLIIIYQSYNEWCVRNRYFGSLSVNKVINAGSATVLKTLFGWTNIFSGGLIAGDFLGRTISASACVVNALKRDKELFSSPSFRQMRWLGKRYIDCPRFILPAQLLNALGGELPVLLMAAYFNTTQIGYYAMAITILALPALVISQAVRDVFRKHADEIYRHTGNCFSIYKKTIFVMTLISLVGFSLFYLIAPTLFSFVLGKEWVTAGEYARIMCPIVAISFVSETVSSMFIVGEKMKRLLWWQSLYFLLTLISLLIGIFIFKDITITLYCFMIGRSIAHIGSLLMTSRIANGK